MATYTCKASVLNYVLTNANGLRGNEEELARKAGWKQIPECGYVIKGKDQKLHCTYRYDSERLVLSKAVSARVVEESHDETVKECSVKYCPYKLQFGV